MNFYIEFAGPPGSGKTTVCTALLKKLRDSGYAVTARKGRRRGAGRSLSGRSLKIRPVRLILLFLTLPVYLLRSLSYSLLISCRAPRRRSKQFRYLFKESFLLRLRLSVSEFVLYDQGPLYRVAMLSPCIRGEKYINLLLGRDDYLIVFLELPFESNLKRLIKRDGKKEKDKDKYIRDIESKKILHDKAADTLESYLSKAVLKIDALEEPDYNAERIIERIKGAQENLSKEKKE